MNFYTKDLRKFTMSFLLKVISLKKGGYKNLGWQLSGGASKSMWQMGGDKVKTKWQ